MAIDVLMPVITDAGEDAVVTAWFVDEGQPCEDGQLIAEVQAEKVAAEVRAPAAGLVVDPVDINEPVAQGTPICRIAAAGEGPPVAATPTRVPEAVGEAPPTLASPAARRLARELGVDLAGLSGSGPGGRITEADVRSVEAERGAPDTGVALAGLREVVARNMRRGHLETAPVTLHSSIVLSGGVPAHVTASVVKAAAVALQEHPALNGVREGDRFTAATTAHVAVAVQTDDGLVAPVVRSPAGRTVGEIAEEIAELAGRAAAKELAAVDFEGGTFTVTNLGRWGIDGFTPIINLPQVAILGVGAVRTGPGFDQDGAVIAETRVVLSLTFDHAFVDGAPAAAFLQRVGELLAVRS
ncbi:MAG: hypothetical protein GXP34_00470 [Actinobacteria bacterium]|nr:hypothetical protein [Actinomycetota bacterium]